MLVHYSTDRSGSTIAHVWLSTSHKAPFAPPIPTTITRRLPRALARALLTEETLVNRTTGTLARVFDRHTSEAVNERGNDGKPWTAQSSLSTVVSLRLPFDDEDHGEDVPPFNLETVVPSDARRTSATHLFSWHGTGQEATVHHEVHRGFSFSSSRLEEFPETAAHPQTMAQSLQWSIDTEGVAFHPVFNIDVGKVAASKTLSTSTCSLQLVLALSESAFFDVYQLRDYFAATPHVRAVVHGRTELEAPTPSPASHSSTAFIQAPLHTLATGALRVPFHLRYHAAESKRQTQRTHVPVTIDAPVYARLACNADMSEDEKWTAFTDDFWTGRFHSMHERDMTPPLHVTPSSATPLQMPVGNIDEFPLVLGMTTLCSSIGTLLIILFTLKHGWVKEVEGGSRGFLRHIAA